MDSFHITPRQTHSTAPVMAFALRGGPVRRETPTLLAARAVDPDSCATLVIDAIYLGHLNRQAMLGAQALLRGDDSGAQVW